jgi:hypothetical protein
MKVSNKNKMINLLSNLISLTILLASIKSSKAFGTFLIATFALSLWSSAEQTTPYAPCPIYLMYSYFSSQIKLVPAQLNYTIPLGTLDLTCFGIDSPPFFCCI